MGQSGPRLVAFVGLLMAFFRQSKRRTALFLETLLNQPCCPALTVKMQTQVTAALRPAYEELVAELPSQEQLGIDESPTKEATMKAWLWTFVGNLFTVFAWRGTRPVQPSVCSRSCRRRHRLRRGLQQPKNSEIQ